MMDEDRLAELGLTPEQIALLMELGGLSGQQDLLSEQMAQAEALRGQAPPQGAYVQGVGQMGAHPLQHIAYGVEKGLAGAEMRRARQQQMEILRQQNERRKMLADALLQRTQQPTFYETASRFF